MTAAVTLAGVALLLVGCGRELSDTRVQGLNSNAATSVACEPNQRAIVHPAIVNGAPVSQVECTSVQGMAAPVAYQNGPVAMPVNYGVPATYTAPGTLDSGRFVPVTYQPRPVDARRTALARQAPVAERHTRSVQKSALIIGGSAVGGAGIGAALGGKKGALVGALLGGGGATLWDQITRRK